MSKMSVGELENLDRLTVRALEFGEGLSAEDRRRLEAERRLIRIELEWRNGPTEGKEAKSRDRS